MPGRVSVKLVLVLAAFAFVGAFRLHADGDDSPGAKATVATLSPSRVNALRSDAVVRPAARPVNAKLAAAPGLPALHRGPVRPHHATHHGAARVTHTSAPVAPAATAAPVVTAAPTAAPVVTAAPPAVAPAAPAHHEPQYVGKGFDSKG
jgi:hypothetical protein